MREELIEEIKTLAVSERYKQDAFFFCGNTTDAPDDRLLAACEGYLKETDGGNFARPEVIETLKAALTEALGKKKRQLKSMVISTVEDENTLMMRNILENAAAL